MFIELEQEKETGGGAIFLNMDLVNSAHLSADGNTLSVSFGPGDHHAFHGEQNIKKLLTVLRPSVLPKKLGGVPGL